MSTPPTLRSTTVRRDAALCAALAVASALSFLAAARVLSEEPPALLPPPPPRQAPVAPEHRTDHQARRVTERTGRGTAGTRGGPPSRPSARAGFA